MPEPTCVPANTDIDNNGVADCQQSSVGRNWVDFGFGGCFVIDPDGTVRPYEDGIVATAFNQFGGDGIPNVFNEDTLIPEADKLAFNLFADYDLTDSLNVFLEAKYVEQSIEFGGPLNTFYDLLTVTPENPFIPEVLQPVADAAGGLYITRDPANLGPNYSQNDRETWRVVGGVRGELDNGWSYEVSGNYGRFEQTNLDRNAVIQDRFFAAIDVIADEDGNPICRSDVDDTPPPTTPFGIPAFTPGFFTFNPGDGSCAPANILGGRGAISQDAIDFITATTVSEFALEQFVVSGYLTGDTEGFLTLPGGPIGFAVGAEYRDEQSESTFDPLVRGVVPVDTDFASAGDLISEDEDTVQNSLVFDPSILIQNAGGGYDVYDVFAEVSVPLLADLPLIDDLTIDGAVRYSEYSTIGETFTWKVGGAYAPISGIRFRAVYSEAVRAPNIDELFSPEQGATFRPDDPCDATEIAALQDPAVRARRVANCQAAGLPEGFRDPLTARFGGVTSGNADLNEETAETITAGVVFSDMIPGLTLSADYWQIEIDDAIASPSAQDVVDNCYDAADFPNQFCQQFTRNADPDSPQFGGFTFLRLQELNFAAIEARGLDLAALYRFDAGPGRVSLNGNATYTDDLDFFFDPISPDEFDPEQRELQRPDWAGNVGVGYEVGDWRFLYDMHFESEQGLRAVEIEEEIDPDVTPAFGPSGFADPIQIRNIAFNYAPSETLTVYGGINNLTGEDPFITEAAYPVSPRGRTLFLGVTLRR